MATPVSLPAPPQLPHPTRQRRSDLPANEELASHRDSKASDSDSESESESTSESGTSGTDDDIKGQADKDRDDRDSGQDTGLFLSLFLIFY